MSMVFEWDEQKARNNVTKHGVSFDEASSIFGDPFSITIPATYIRPTRRYDS